MEFNPSDFGKRSEVDFINSVLAAEKQYSFYYHLYKWQTTQPKSKLLIS